VPDRADEGLADTGNGFIWTDEEIRDGFPALAQMPLGSANDLGNILGWGRKYPGFGGSCTTRRPQRLKALQDWIDAVISPQSPIANFDVWGIMPKRGEESCNFKLCELTGKRGASPKAKVDGQMSLLMKEAGLPTPFFICLYFSAGFFAYTVARFQINRHDTHLKNDLEYVRQGAGIIFGRTAPQMLPMCQGITVDCDQEGYFPPRRDKGNTGNRYRDVGFYNINWQAHMLHGADRAGVTSRMGCSSGSREPVKFNDGFLDVWRFRLGTLFKNPGPVLQVEKKKEFHLKYEGGKGKGVFFQWDGESRFAFSPTGSSFDIFIRKVLNIPVVMGPKHNRRLTGGLDNGSDVHFAFCGETQEEKDAAKRRVLKSLIGKLDTELNAKKDEIRAASFPLAEDIWSHGGTASTSSAASAS
jgi:hypothetical protein